MSNHLTRFGFLVAAVAFSGVALAQGVADPTRPPDGWLPADPSTAKSPAAAAKPQHTGEPVQLLLVGKTRRYAIVRGELVGDKTGEIKLVEVKRNDVTVQSDRGRETLNLFPDVEKTPPRKQRGMGYPDVIEKKEQK